MAETYIVEGYKTPYTSIIKARAAAWRMYNKKASVGKFGTTGVKVRIFQKIAPNVFSEEYVVLAHPFIVGATGIYHQMTHKVARLDSKGLVYDWVSAPIEGKRR